jgi:hypothetical protein
MTWSYTEDTLNTTTDIGRLNTVRLLVGDTDHTDQLLQDEEVFFSISEANNNVYYAASWCASTIAAKFSRNVTTELDGQLREDYSDLANQYYKLSGKLRQDGAKYSGTALGLNFGGTEVSGIDTVRQLTDRVKPSFTKDQFKIDGTGEDYDTSYNNN